MGALKKYRVTVNGHATVLNLTEQEATLYPDAELAEPAPATPAKARPAPQNKARQPADK